MTVVGRDEAARTATHSTGARRRTRVLLVDDSAVVRQVLGGALARDPEIEVIGAASDPIFAIEHMKRDWPDVVVLDIEMPRMDGLTFLRKVMAFRPTPVVICSTLTEKGADVTMDALAAGAVGIVTKPTSGLRQFLECEAAEIARTVKSAAAANTRRLASAPDTSPRRIADDAAPAGPMRFTTTDSIVAIGTSTGGTQALERVLAALPRIRPGIVVVQHMPEKFTAAFAKRLDSLCRSDVREAADGDRVLPGQTLIAPGGRHMAVERDGAHYRVHLTDTDRVNRHKPSVDVLFESVATHVGRNALGVIMTGMGDDGARGLLRMREAGARTIGQNERTCVVYGMPKVAAEMGAVEELVALDAIPERISEFADRGPAAAGRPGRESA